MDDEFNDLVFTVLHQHPQGRDLFYRLCEEYIENPKLCRDANGGFDVNATLIAAAQQEVIMKLKLIIKDKIIEAENERRNKPND